MRAWSVLLFVAAAGCADVNRLRDAQESFSRAAEIENRARFEWRGGGFEAAADTTAARAGYGAALIELEALAGESRSRDALRADGLWGTTLALRALCEWRLGLHDRALASAAEAATEGDALGPRDRAMMAALPGLVMADQLYAKVERKRRREEAGGWEAALGLGSRAMEILEAVRKETDPEHPLRLYLYQAQLAAWRNLRQAHGAWHRGQDFKIDDPVRLRAKACFEEFENVGPPDAVQFWKSRGGF